MKNQSLGKMWRPDQYFSDVLLGEGGIEHFFVSWAVHFHPSLMDPVPSPSQVATKNVSRHCQTPLEQ